MLYVIRGAYGNSRKLLKACTVKENEEGNSSLSQSVVPGLTVHT